MCGRAPKKLVDLCGYDPVIALGENPSGQIADVLEHVGKWQLMADRNRAVAAKIAGWDKRMPAIMSAIEKLG